ncbi:phosphatase PAP2 family protein [Blastopirellula marina]|uniref:Phosphatidic acid phosphatase type 2/haloperoxidase domain-containing protein n=1 Tax=Blastopirellula marina TaxID=124 RepID=A0A2S8GDF7_9BACT|nr:phosphatase PAP2 family protein [Blastopirellula marina]PQO42498.1 hypothetical protein C5Y93_29685 [Blastopirellula marina]
MSTYHVESEIEPVTNETSSVATSEKCIVRMQTLEQEFDGRFYLVLSLALAIVGCGAFFVDRAISGQLAEPPHEFRYLGGDLKKLISLSEVFGHGTGVAMVVLAVFALDLQNRWKVGLLIATAAGGGMAANFAKFFGVARYRPHAFDFSQPIWDSFYQWFPFLNWFSQEELRQAALQSFPSGHSATAAGLCVGLCFLYPHGRWYFFLVAALACFQRVAFRMHFPSDAFLGAALGMATATLLLQYGRVPEMVDWAERKIRGRLASGKPE